MASLSASTAESTGAINSCVGLVSVAAASTTMDDAAGRPASLRVVSGEPHYARDGLIHLGRRDRLDAGESRGRTASVRRLVRATMDVHGPWPRNNTSTDCTSRGGAP